MRQDGVRLDSRVSLNREEAAAAIGVSPNVFDRMVDAGELPPPIKSKVARRQFWSVLALEAAMLGQLPPSPMPAPVPVDDDESVDPYAKVKL